MHEPVEREMRALGYTLVGLLGAGGMGRVWQARELSLDRIVLRFGRYPHRNELLERESTADELAFMADGGPTFGQKKR